MMHIALAFDNNYLIPAYALLASIFKHNPKAIFTFHVVLQGIDEQEQQQLRDYICKHNGSRLYCYTLDDRLLSTLPMMSPWNWSAMPYVKMFFPLLLSEKVDRLLVLDVDMLVVNGLDELYNWDLGDHPLGAVKDSGISCCNAYWDLHLREDYFNSGMMLIDVERWNKLKISEQAIAFARDNPDKIYYVDQDALNAAVAGRHLLLPEKYNLIHAYIPQSASRQFYDEFLKGQTILHFTFPKPWHYLSTHPYRHLYRHYLKMSPKKGARVITDFSIAKLPAYIYIKLLEWYLSTPVLVKFWRTLKMKMKKGLAN
ncbi:UDP-glucose:(galactosyl)LPS alpha-1,2-glucosyltransferase [Thermonema lapsum]|uniref:UDP-glucose:(Galactosyl)LPS alpha-1,2-glucosyltransferase n=1 Tax=Thermonema lapsum TaxID=28195 RepID=A0A846MMQ0_9BACT|nr:glycosyltransferase family 8 protein [Thermonema lapsum]NIK72702.1 UDP-glucose:(galactosyl)LPS alpha-1,2-glucosyltransferase [Thermonema lapsum]